MMKSPKPLRTFLSLTLALTLLLSTMVPSFAITDTSDMDHPSIAEAMAKCYDAIKEYTETFDTAPLYEAAPILVDAISGTVEYAGVYSETPKASVKKAGKSVKKYLKNHKVDWIAPSLETPLYYEFGYPDTTEGRLESTPTYIAYTNTGELKVRVSIFNGYNFRTRVKQINYVKLVTDDGQIIAEGYPKAFNYGMVFEAYEKDGNPAEFLVQDDEFYLYFKKGTFVPGLDSFEHATIKANYTVEKIEESYDLDLWQYINSLYNFDDLGELYYLIGRILELLENWF